MKPLVPPLALLSESLWALQTPELTAYGLTLTLLSSERRRHSRSRSRRGRRRPLLLLWGGGREGTVGVSDMCPPLVSRLTTVPSAELAWVPGVGWSRVLGWSGWNCADGLYRQSTA